MVGRPGERTVSDVVVVLVVVRVVVSVVVVVGVLVAAVVVGGVVSGRARRIESARAVESRVIESRRIVSIRAIESARAAESRCIVCMRVMESARATESRFARVVAELARGVTSPADSFVTRTRRSDVVVRLVVSVVVRRVVSLVVRRVVSACAEALEAAPSASATAAALANEIRKFIGYSSPHFRHCVRPRGRFGGRGSPPSTGHLASAVPRAAVGAPSGPDRPLHRTLRKHSPCRGLQVRGPAGRGR